MSRRDLDGESADGNRQPDVFGDWDRLIQGAGPASLLVFIESRMSETMRLLLSPEDIFQEALLHAWRDREHFEWRGRKSFRAWLLTIIENRLRDASAHETALKRGGGKVAVTLSSLRSPEFGSSQSSGPSLPFASTTPSRIASYRERAAAMRAALEGLPEDVRDVIRLRIFEQKTLEEIAKLLGLGTSATLRRFRKGIGIYHHLLHGVLSSRIPARKPVSGRRPEEKPDDPPADLS